MKRIVVAIGICLLLLGGVIMPIQGKTIEFTIQMRYIEHGANVSIFMDDDYIGQTDENGQLRCTTETKGDMRGISHTFLLQKEGYMDESYRAVCEDGKILNFSFNNIIKESTPIPEPIPESTPVPMPTVPPTPEGHKSQHQQIEELQNQTAEHEQRLSWLEGMIQKITEFLRTLGFKD